MDVAIGALDDPTIAEPTVQMNPADRQPAFERLHLLPGRPAAEEASNAAYLASVVSYQHPDHDTETWPPEGRPQS